MPSGGARSRSGPAPDPNALRRDRDAGEWVTLPSSGRVGDLPVWPLADPTQRELDLWEQDWRRPQAIVWERDGLERVAAMYVRQVLTAESRQATAADRTMFLRLSDTLLLTPASMAAAKVKIGEVTAAPTRRASGSSGPSARSRFKVVQGGGE